MNWKEPQLKFPSSDLSCALVDFCDEVLGETKRTALGLLDELRSCRVTLKQLRKVDAVEFVPRVKDRFEGGTKDIVRSTLDDPSAGAVKSFLMARISEYRAQVVSQYQTVVPREKASFEAAFDSFVEACLLQRQTEHESEQGTNNNQSTEDAFSSLDLSNAGPTRKRGNQPSGAQESTAQSIASTMARSQWFEDQVESGASQPHLWKVFVVFQKQLRDACEARSKEPLPPPLFSTLPKKDEKQVAKPKEKEKEKKKKKRQRRQRSRSKSSFDSAGDLESTPEAGHLVETVTDAKENRNQSPSKPHDHKTFWKDTSGQSNCALGLNKDKVETGPAVGDMCTHHHHPTPTPWMGQHVAIIGPNGQFIPVSCTRA